MSMQFVSIFFDIFYLQNCHHEWHFSYFILKKGLKRVHIPKSRIFWKYISFLFLFFIKFWPYFSFGLIVVRASMVVWGRISSILDCFQDKFNRNKPRNVYSVYFHNFEHRITTYTSNIQVNVCTKYIQYRGYTWKG